MANLVDSDELVCQMVWTLGQHRAYIVRNYMVSLTGGTHVTIEESLVAIAETPYRTITRRVSRPAYPEGVFGHRQRPTQSTTEGPIGENINISGRPSLPLPPQVRGLVYLITGDDPARRPGKVFIPYPSEAANTDDGKPDPAYVGLLTNMGANLAETLQVAGNDGTADLIPVVRYRAAEVSLPVIGWRAAEKWATQRRRVAGTSITPLPYGSGPPGV